MAATPLSDFGLQWFKDIVNQMSVWFTRELTDGYRGLSHEFFNTPTPTGGGLDAVFAPPSSDAEPWHTIYTSLVGGEVMILSLLLLFLAVQARHFARIFDFGSAYVDRQSRQSAWTGAIAIVGWYWVAVLFLYLVEAVTIGLVPDVSRVGQALLEILPAAVGNPILTLLFAVVGGVSMALLKAVFFLRDVLLYVYLYGMPVGFALTFGNLPLVSDIARRFCRGFVPLAILPLPAVLLFRGYSLLFGGREFFLPEDPFLKYLIVVSLPVVALYLTWKTFRYASPLVAGALGGATRTAATVGGVAALGYTIGPKAAVTAARWGPTAGVSQAATTRYMAERESNGSGGNEGRSDPAYRRTENDP